MTEEQRNPSGDVQYVLDGGALLHRVPWPQGSTYESENHLYVRYVNKYGVVPLSSMDITMIRQPKTPHTCEERDIV